MYVILRFLHIASAIAFVGGVFSRQLARSVAMRCNHPQEIALGFRVADPIERFMVIPGSNLATLFGVILALVAGVPMFGFLQGSSSNWLLAANVLILSEIVLVPSVFLPRGKVFGQHLEEAIQRGEVTPELRASMNDQIVRFSQVYELAATSLIVILMVFKPI
jgi:uncharacterized membrane protein